MAVHLFLGAFITVLAVVPLVSGQARCDLAKASECIEELESILNDTKDEGRTVQDKIRMCTLTLRNNNISTCYTMNTAMCPDNPDTQRQASRWSSITDEIDLFCDNDCQDYKEIKACKEKVNMDAIDQGTPSIFCRTYGESKQCLADNIDGDSCGYKEDIYDALYDGSYFRNYYQNVCLTDCPNLDETVNILKNCYTFLENYDVSNVCPAHRNFSKCLNSYPAKPCDQFHTLIPLILYRYDYLKNHRLCQDDACQRARTCQSHVQRQYDTTLGSYVDRSSTLYLDDLCLVVISGNNHTECYDEHIDECTTVPSHPLRQQWGEVFRDIHNLCNKDCGGVMNTIPRCHNAVLYESFYSNRWSQFCQSHTNATTCVTNLNCPLGTAMFSKLLKSEVEDFVANVCVNECSNLEETLFSVERCVPFLTKTVTSANDCSNYHDFTSCMLRATVRPCKEVDDILNFLSPNFTSRKDRCTTTPTSGASTLQTTASLLLVTLMTSFQIMGRL
ncbi:uncharacterized protein LOC124138664 isoform X3 [Haliotis rufescens]|uniref:uncharacterized protein LOC124138664 isoform X3 n=1 Tax=Haliotis rufescens TaxID=6454 RepID=UPI00201FAAD2|nr:uncharacterized protein LOC124138664 isoform X3 [Haliotis rufescens]